MEGARVTPRQQWEICVCPNCHGLLIDEEHTDREGNSQGWYCISMTPQGRESRVVYLTKNRDGRWEELPPFLKYVSRGEVRTFIEEAEYEAAVAERDEAQANLESLREAYRDGRSLSLDSEELAARSDRLTQALERIAGIHPDGPEAAATSLQQADEIARAALDNPEEPK